MHSDLPQISLFGLVSEHRVSKIQQLTASKKPSNRNLRLSRGATNNFRLYDADLVRTVGIDSTGVFAVALELTAKAFARGEPIAEAPTIWRDRVAGRSRLRLFRGLPRYLYWYGVALTRGKIFGRRAKWRQ